MPLAGKGPAPPRPVPPHPSEQSPVGLREGRGLASSGRQHFNRGRAHSMVAAPTGRGSAQSSAENPLPYLLFPEPEFGNSELQLAPIFIYLFI